MPDGARAERVGVGGYVVPHIDIDLVTCAEDDRRQCGCRKREVDRGAGERVARLAHGRNRGIGASVVLPVADVEVGSQVAVARIDARAYRWRPVARKDALALKRGHVIEVAVTRWV